MIRPKAKTSDILGHTKPCIFSSREGIHPFKYDPCRSCDGYNTVCENYLPNKCVYQSRQEDKTSDKVVLSTTSADTLSQRLFNMPYDNHKGFELIRRLNDRGAI